MDTTGQSSNAKMQPVEQAHWLTPFFDAPEVQNFLAAPSHSKKATNDFARLERDKFPGLSETPLISAQKGNEGFINGCTSSTRMHSKNSTKNNALPSKAGQSHLVTQKTDELSFSSKPFKHGTSCFNSYSTVTCACPAPVTSKKPSNAPNMCDLCDLNEQHLKGIDYVKCMLKSAKLFDFSEDLLSSLVDIHEMSWIASLMLDNKKIQKSLNLSDETYLLSLQATIMLADLTLDDLEQDARANIVKFAAAFKEDAKHIKRIKSRKNLLFLCKACNVNLNPQDLESHFVGSKHLAKSKEATNFTNPARHGLIESLLNKPRSSGSFSSLSRDPHKNPVMSENAFVAKASSNQSKIESKVFEPTAAKLPAPSTQPMSDVLTQFRTIKSAPNSTFCRYCETLIPGALSISNKNLIEHANGSMHRSKLASVNGQRSRPQSSDSSESINKPKSTTSDKACNSISRASAPSSEDFTELMSDVLTQFRTIKSAPNSAFCRYCETMIPGALSISNKNLIEHANGSKHRSKLASVNGQRSRPQSSDSSDSINRPKSTISDKACNSTSRASASSSEDFTELMNNVMKKHVAGEVPLNYDSKNIGILGFYCEICRKVILTDLEWLQHLDDIVHKMNVVKASQKTGLYHCLICKIVIFCPLVNTTTGHSHIHSHQHNFIKTLVEKRFSPISIYVQMHKVLTIEANNLSCNSYSLNLGEKFTLPEKKDSSLRFDVAKAKKMSSCNSAAPNDSDGHQSRIATRSVSKNSKGESSNVKYDKVDKRIEYLEESDFDESSNSDDYEHLFPEEENDDSEVDYDDEDDDDINSTEDDSDSGSDDDGDESEDVDSDLDDNDFEHKVSDKEVSALMKELRRTLSFMDSEEELSKEKNNGRSNSQSVSSNARGAAGTKKEEAAEKAASSVKQSKAKKGKDPKTKKEQKGFSVTFTGIDTSIAAEEWGKRFSEAGKIKEYVIDPPSRKAEVYYFKKSAIRKIFSSKDSILKKYDIGGVETTKHDVDERCLDLLQNKREFTNKVASTLLTLDYEMNSPESKLRLSMLNESVLFAVQLIYPNCKIYEFGSRVSGLATAESDYDLFLDLTGTMYQGASVEQDQESRIEMVKHIRKIATVFRQMPKEFSNVVPITSARVPILKFKHIKTDSQSDLSFKNGLSVENTKLVRKYLGMNEQVRWLVIAVKTWANACGLLSSSHFTTYALTWLVLFFLMTKKSVPSVGSLMKSKKGNKIQGWRCSFDDKDSKVAFQSGKNIELLYEFFDYYEKFDFWKNVVCTRSGTCVRKFIFSDHVAHLFPNEIKEDYLNHVAKLGKEREFKVGCCSVQDPFDLSHNITRQVRPGVLRCFQRCCYIARAQIDKWPSLVI